MACAEVNMGNLTIQLLSDIAVHEHGRDLSNPLDVREIVNMAGQHLVAMHEWNWLMGREARLRPRPQISVSGATWTEATKTLAKVGAFTNYSFLSKDVGRDVSGTGATDGTYEVASRVSDDAITLATSIGAAANGQTDIAMLLPNDQIALPSDFDLQQIVAWGMTNGLVGMLEMTSPQGMTSLRSWPGLTSITSFWGLVSYVRGASGGGPPVPRLELWPKTSSSDEEFVIWYRGGWINPSSDSEALQIPEWLNALYLEVFKAFVMGGEEPEGGSIDRRLQALRSGPMYVDAVRRDAQVQFDLGPISDTWLAGSGFDQSQRFSMYRTGTVN
jgi:hypothetical protein